MITLGKHRLFIAFYIAKNHNMYSKIRKTIIVYLPTRKTSCFCIIMLINLRFVSLLMIFHPWRDFFR